MPALVVRIDRIAPQALVESGESTGEFDLSHCIIHMQGADSYTAIESGAAFNEGDLAIFITHGSVVRSNAVTNTWPSLTVVPHVIAGTGRDGEPPLERDGHLVSFPAAHQSFGLPADVDEKFVKIGDDLAEQMSITTIDMVPQHEQDIMGVLEQIPKDALVTIYRDPELYTLSECKHKDFPDYVFHVHAEGRKEECVQYATRTDDGKVVSYRDAREMYRALKLKSVKVVWDATPLDDFMRTYEGMTSFLNTEPGKYLLRWRNSDDELERHYVESSPTGPEPLVESDAVAEGPLPV